MRGSWHDKAIREFTIDKGGMKMGRPFRNVTGILAGAPVHVSPSDVERAWSHFESDTARVDTGADTGHYGVADIERRRSSPQD